MNSGTRLSLNNAVRVLFSGVNACFGGILARPGSLARAVAYQVILFVSLLLIGIQVITFVAIDNAVSTNSEQKIREELQLGKRIFLRLQVNRSQQLITAATILTSDFAFRQTLMTGHKATIASALRNHGLRIGASKMILVSPDNKVLADASESGGTSGGDSLFPFPDLTTEASTSDTTSAIRLIDGVPYQLVVVPVLAPTPVGWVVLGFSIDSKVAAELGELASLEVSFATWKKNEGWQLVASTMPAQAREGLLSMLMQAAPENPAQSIPNLSADGYVTSASTLASNRDGVVVAIVQRSLAEAISRFNALRISMLILATVSMACTIIGSIMIARSISRPVTALVEFARRLERGDYEQSFSEPRAHELSELASALNNMRMAVSAREQQIKAMAYHDALTGLPNRALFNDRLSQAIAVARRLNHPVSVMLIDLNRFKEVNDTFGHHVGDLLLREVAMRLQGALTRSSDTVARFGGDEFAVLLPTTSAKMAENVARKILQLFKDPLAFETHLLDMEGSIGLATFPEHGEDQHILMSHADAAMYHAKRKRLGFSTYQAHLDGKLEMDMRISMSGELRRAVETNELVLYYQPRIHLPGRHACEAEALVRWQHPTRGFLPPNEFIPFAEETGYIREITHWVMNEAFSQSVRWRKQGLEVAISINLSVRDLLGPGFVAHCSTLLAKHGAQAQWFTLEITESVIMEDSENALATARQLHDMGFSLSIDDFGTGYSSLAMLKLLPVAELKIDRSFVMNMVNDAQDMRIVRSVIDLAHNLGILVVAEGIESEQALDLLTGMGCDVAQGYHICKPVPANAVEEWLVRRQDSKTPGLS